MKRVYLVKKSTSDAKPSFSRRKPYIISFFFDVQVWPYAAHQVEIADWHTARSGSGGSSSVLLGVSKHDLDGRAADPRIRNRREVDSSLVHVGVACCH
jgi:hypothetical protein